MNCIPIETYYIENVVNGSPELQICKVDCYQDCKIVCTGEEKYFLAVDGEWTTYFPINCCPICGRNFDETT